jgi:hypothetical protein
VLDAAAFRLHLLIAVGDSGGFSRDLEDFAQLADELRQPFHQYHATAMRAAQALFVGKFAEAERLARKAATLGMRLTGLDASGAFGMQMFTLAQERGELPQLAPAVEAVCASDTGVAPRGKSRAGPGAGRAGQHEQASPSWNGLLRDSFRRSHATAFGLPVLLT